MSEYIGYVNVDDWISEDTNKLYGLIFEVFLGLLLIKEG